MKRDQHAGKVRLKVSPNPRPNYQNPTRPLALEAGVVAALANASARLPCPNLADYEISNFVQRWLPWATRVEVQEARERMIRQGRVVEVRIPGRSIPLYTLPDAHAPAPSRASSSPA